MEINLNFNHLADLDQTCRIRRAIRFAHTLSKAPERPLGHYNKIEPFDEVLRSPVTYSLVS